MKQHIIMRIVDIIKKGYLIIFRPTSVTVFTACTFQISLECTIKGQILNVPGVKLYADLDHSFYIRCNVALLVYNIAIRST